MQSLDRNNKFVYAWVPTKNGQATLVPFYFKSDYKKTSQQFKDAFNTYQMCAYEISIPNIEHRNTFAFFRFVIASKKLIRMERKEGIQRINLKQIYSNEKQD